MVGKGKTFNNTRVKHRVKGSINRRRWGLVWKLI
uniref:Uncharacterized protein n=1 Tax=Cucumis melo TaxID=3656 RepID=A0A9I9E2J4_CUCME